MKDRELIFKALAGLARWTLLDHLCAPDGEALSKICEHVNMTRRAATQFLAATKGRKPCRHFMQ